jgi:hypothetical protein
MSIPSDCPTGFYCPTPTTITECPTGYYCPSPTTVICNPCTAKAGSYCVWGYNNTLTALCPPGTYCPTGSSGTIPCTSGNYCTTGSAIQTPCSIGSYCPNTSTQLTCPTGTYCPVGSYVATPCTTIDSYCPQGSSLETFCPTGSYCPNSFTILPYTFNFMKQNFSNGFPNFSPTICISNEGKYQTAKFKNGESIQVSDNFGKSNSWKDITDESESIYIKMSRTGQYQTAVSWDCFVKTSSNYGVTWSVPINISANFPSEKNADSLEMTDDGRIQIITGTNYVNLYSYQYKSLNFGVDWIQTILPRSPSAIILNMLSISSDGRFQLGANDGSNGGPNNIYLSTNYGNTWTSVTGVTDPNTFCLRLKISSSGKYQFCIIRPVTSTSSSSIKISSNFGVNWTTISLSGTTQGIFLPNLSISASGKYVIMSHSTDYYDLFYYSTNYGNNFTTISSINQFIQNIAISGDGNYSSIIALTGSGTTSQCGIYTSNVFSNVITSGIQAVSS